MLVQENCEHSWIYFKEGIATQYRCTSCNKGFFDADSTVTPREGWVEVFSLKEMTYTLEIK
jgi:transposase-like protein